MLRKYALFVGVAAIGALVTSCGGGSSGTPTPTDTSTATPTPTPTSSQVDFSLTQAFSTQSVNANAVFAYFTADGSTDEVFNGAARLNGTSTFAFVDSPDSATLSFPDLTDAVAFLAADFVGVTGTERSYARTNEGLVMSLPFAHVLQVSYELTQDFTRDTVAGSLRGTRVAFFFNQVTATDSVTTTLTYTGDTQVVGGDPGVTAADAISSPSDTFSLTTTGTKIAGTVEIYEDVNGTATLVATLPFDATVNSSSTFTGSLADAGHNLDGNFAGALAGPNREELFIIFSVSGNADASDNTDDRRYVGRFIGAR